MKRSCAILFAGVFYLIGVAGQYLLAEASPDAYRAAFRSWREAEPTLEEDARQGGAAIITRASHAAAEAAKYGQARTTFWRELGREQGQIAALLQEPMFQPAPNLAPAQDALRFVAKQTSSVTANIAAFSKDPDRGIQQLRSALEKERIALEALNSAIVDRQKSEDVAAQKAMEMERSRAKAFDQYKSAIDAIDATATSADRETAEWASYYQKLAEVSGGIAPVVSQRTSITPLPLARYTGEWTYSRVAGTFHMLEPESADLVVYENGGQASGTFSARFKLPPGSKDNPVVRFNFSGEFRAARRQTFAIETNDGSKGMIELNPANEFNRLEVSFEMTPASGKIRAGDLLLVKK